jgi:NADH:ubiquinone oxidoreductase subunit
MPDFIIQIFAWWHKATIGTRFTTWLRGEFVGEDEFANRYYRTRGNGIDPTLHFQRRWVIYSGAAEATMIPPGWWGWMHHKSDIPPSETDYHPFPWQLPHIPNLTGTPAAYRPPGSALTAERRPRVDGDYDAWSPEA